VSNACPEVEAEFHKQVHEKAVKKSKTKTSRAPLNPRSKPAVPAIQSKLLHLTNATQEKRIRSNSPNKISKSKPVETSKPRHLSQSGLQHSKSIPDPIKRASTPFKDGDDVKTTFTEGAANFDTAGNKLPPLPQMPKTVRLASGEVISTGANETSRTVAVNGSNGTSNAPVVAHKSGRAKLSKVRKVEKENSQHNGSSPQNEQSTQSVPKQEKPSDAKNNEDFSWPEDCF
jgi:hypothetical protein